MSTSISTKPRMIICVAASAVAVIAILIWIAGRSQGASIVGHWEGPEGGLWFDASSEYCQMDIMHTFWMGHWKSSGADTVDLQFYDLLEDPAVLDRAELRASARVTSDQGRKAIDITMADKSTIRFRYLGPPSGDLSEIERYKHKRYE